MTTGEEEQIRDFVNGQELFKKFIDDLCLTLMDMSHPIAVVVNHMKNGGYTKWEMGTSPTTHFCLVTFTHTTGEVVSGEAIDPVIAFQKALDAGIAQARARKAGGSTVHTSAG